MNYYEKYIKYKNKYLYLQNQIGGLRIPFQISKSVEEKLKTELYNLLKEKFGLTKNDVTIEFMYDNENIKAIDMHNLKSYQLNAITNDLHLIKEKLGVPRSPELIKQQLFKELLQDINTDKTEKIIAFFDKMNSNDLYTYIHDMRNKDDFNKIILYYIARQSNLKVMKYLVSKLGIDKMKELLKIQASDGRTVLFGAVNAIQSENRKEIYTLIRDLTDPSLYKVKFMHNGKEPKDMKEWAELRGYHMSKEISDEFIYADVSKLVR
jgi:hypothetical protein